MTAAQPGPFRASRIAVFFDGEVAEVVLDANRAVFGRWYAAGSGNQSDNWALNGSWSPWYGIGAGVIDISIAAASPVPASQNVAYITLITETGDRRVHKITPGGVLAGVNL